MKISNRANASFITYARQYIQTIFRDDIVVVVAAATGLYRRVYIMIYRLLSPGPSTP